MFWDFALPQQTFEEPEVQLSHFFLSIKVSRCAEERNRFFLSHANVGLDMLFVTCTTLHFNLAYLTSSDFISFPGLPSI